MHHDTMLWTTAKLAVVAVVTAITLTACVDESKGTSTPPSVKATTSSPSSTGSSDSVTEKILAAGKTALQGVTNSSMSAIETENGGWEVQVVTSDGIEHELMISKDGSKVLDGPSTKNEDAKDRAKHKDRVKSVRFAWTKAVEKLASEVPGGNISELSLDSERGKTVWEADVIDGSNVKHEFTIDAVSGKVLENKKSD